MTIAVRVSKPVLEKRALIAEILKVTVATIQWVSLAVNESNGMTVSESYCLHLIREHTLEYLFQHMPHTLSGQSQKINSSQPELNNWTKVSYKRGR
jgi:hypothetical protein